VFVGERVGASVGTGVRVNGNGGGVALGAELPVADGVMLAGGGVVGVGVVMAKVGALTIAKQTAIKAITAHVPRSVLRIIA